MHENTGNELLGKQCFGVKERGGGLLYKGSTKVIIITIPPRRPLPLLELWLRLIAKMISWHYEITHSKLPRELSTLQQRRWRRGPAKCIKFTEQISKIARCTHALHQKFKSTDSSTAKFMLTTKRTLSFNPLKSFFCKLDFFILVACEKQRKI